jgi:hypothetical protein
MMPIIANSYPSKLIIEGDSLEPDRKQVGLGGHKKLAFLESLAGTLETNNWLIIKRNKIGDE